MRQTLFTIPQWLFEGPLLIGWTVLSLIVLVLLSRKQGWKASCQNFLPVAIAGAAFIGLLLPRIGIYELDPANIDGPPIHSGLAIRGYGLFVLLGIAAGVGVSIWRGHRVGADPDRIVSLALWMIATGVIGARAFYVIQFRDQFPADNLPKLIGDVLNLTVGGMVVYGSLIGALLGAIFYLWWARLPALKYLDIAAVGMLVGLSLGRIGCLMNGCCFGGLCDVPQIAMSFPGGSPPFMRQAERGELIGIDPEPDSALQGEADRARSRAGWFRAAKVEPGSIADRRGLRAGEWYRIQLPSSPLGADPVFRLEQEGVPTGKSLWIEKESSPLEIPLSEVPQHSRGVYPSQLMAAVDAMLLAVVLWCFFPFRKYDGRVLALLFVLHGVSRYLLEVIRDDGTGAFGTDLTIGQWISVAGIAGGSVLFLAAGRIQGSRLIGDQKGGETGRQQK
jgi:phosphatidylglycerol---prolipoprotein diacylglyceryl transferase